MAFYNPLIKPKAHINRNGFDLSQRHVFSAKIGQLLPVMSLDCVPNDYHEIDLNAFTRTVAVDSDAFARVTQHFEFYFVPYRQLYHNWDKFITDGHADSHSPLFTSSNSGFAGVNIPSFSVAGILNNIKTAANFDYTQTTNPAYSWLTDVFQIPSCRNTLRLLDLLGYGSYYSCFGDNTLKNIDAGIIASYGSQRLNLFRAGAYQKIWYDWYRNKHYDRSSDLVYCWNFDDLANIPSGEITNSGLRAADFLSDVTYGNAVKSLGKYSPFIMRYRQWKKDLFTSVLPERQFGVVSTVDVSIPNFGFERFKAVNSGAVTDNPTYVHDDSGFKYLSFTDNGGYQNSTWQSDRGPKLTNFDVYAQRKAEVLQKWKENVMRAGYSTGSQYEAHYGVRPEFADENMSKFLGACSAPLEINPIYSTNGANQTSFGDICGRGQMFSNGKFKYKNGTEFGVLMCIYSLVPESDYDATGVDKQNTFSDKFDWFTSEFEDLGPEPVLFGQISNVGPLVNRGGSVSNQVVGYQPRYWCYKTAIDKVHGEFEGAGQSAPDAQLSFVQGVFRHWVIPRFDLQNSPGYMTLSNLYINPSSDGSIFGWTTDNQNSDHYLVNAYFDVKSVRPMSVLGMVQW